MNKGGLILGLNNKNHRGPGIVAINLMKGLNKIEYPWFNTLGESNNPESFQNPGSIDLKFGLLQHGFAPGGEVTIDLLGPNVFVMPREASELISISKALVVPSQWCKDKYQKYDAEILKGKPIYTWAAGVDTDEFSFTQREIQKPENVNVMVYIKNRDDADLSKIIDLLGQCGIRMQHIEIIKYGYYSQRSLKEACKRNDVAILYTHTESQGLANMEIMSMGIPCLVSDWNHWSYLQDSSVESFEASSCPYFDDSCGKKVAAGKAFSLTKEDIEEFLHSYSLSRYNPRDYIVNNFSLVVAAKNYVDIITKL